MDQIANLVIDLSVDTADFKNEMPRVKKLLDEVSGKTDIVTQRQKNLIESLKRQGRAYVDGSIAASDAGTRQKQAMVMVAQGYDQVAQRVDMTQRHIAALSQKLQEERAQAAAVAAAQDQASAAFYRQIDSVKSLENGLQQLQRIQTQIRQARNSGGIAQQDYLALTSEIAAKTRTLTDAEAAATQQKTRFIQRLKEQTTRQKLSSTELLRAQAAQLGVSSAADVYIRKLESAGTVTHSLGLKSAAARRELGVIIGELARGNFGALRGSSITLANRAGWLETLMSPKGLAVGGVVTGVATAVYGLGKAWYEGGKEGEEFNKQLILTGNYAGKTAGQLQEMARSIAGNGVTQHDVAGVLAQVVGSGAFGGADLSRVANAAARLKQAIGQDVSETISQFKKLKDDPVNAVGALNDSLHFLTATQYQQISAAQAAGDSHRAAALAMQAYSDAVIQRTGAVQDNLGTLEKAWNWVRNAASGAWDAMLGVGRNPDSAMKRQDSFAQWQAAEKEYQLISRNLKVDPDYNGSNPLQKADAERLRNAREQLALKKAAYDEADKAYAQEGLAAARKKQRTDQQGLAIRNQQEFNQLVKSGATQTEKRVQAEQALNRLIAKNRQAAKDGVAVLWTDKDIATARAGIEKNYKETKTPKTAATRNDEASRLLLQYSQQQAQVEGQIAAAKRSSGVSTDRMTEAHKQLLALQQRISDLSGKKLTADEQSVLAHKDELVQALTLLDVKQQELQRQSALNDLKKKAIQLESQLKLEEQSQRQQHDLDLATVGMGDVQKQRYQEQFNLRQKFAQQQEQLERDSRQKGTYGSAEYSEAEQKLRDSLNVQLNENRHYWQQLSVEQGDWKNGATRAFQDFAADADNVSGMTEKMFSSAFSSMSNGLATFVTTGKLNFKSFTASLLSDLAKIMAQMAMMQAVKGVGKALGFGVTANADGAGYRSASLSRYSGSVVNRPTFFAFAKGAGVMGEAGPEAILPLKRGANGKLGVVAAGGGMVMFAPQYHININNDAGNGQIGPGALKAVYDVSRKAAADFFARQFRDGGRLS
ncbi:phage tail tape measure protein [Salmonella enterica subsp. enterica serovar Eastbourne]|nr:phage tail tape measure protein [Salmonella enterica subsp. enterica serovar Eastbourne]